MKNRVALVLSLAGLFGLVGAVTMEPTVMVLGPLVTVTEEGTAIV